MLKQHKAGFGVLYQRVILVGLGFGFYPLYEQTGGSVLFDPDSCPLAEFSHQSICILK